MGDDLYIDGYDDGRSDTRAEYNPAFWWKDGKLPWTPPSSERVPMNVHPEARDRLKQTLMNDGRFHGLGYSQFIMMALDLLGQ